MRQPSGWGRGTAVAAPRMLSAMSTRQQQREPLRCLLQRRRIGGNQFDEVGLARGAGFLEYAAEMGLHGRIRDAESLGDFANASHFDNREQHAKLGGRQPEGLPDD